MQIIPDWDSILAEFFRENKTIQAQREYYEAVPHIQPYRAQLPDGYRLVLADQELLENPAIQGSGGAARRNVLRA